MHPKGVDLLRTLVELLAEQNGVKIRFSIERAEEVSACKAQRTD